MFVAKKVPETNEIYVVPSRLRFNNLSFVRYSLLHYSDHPSLYSQGIVVQGFNWTWEDSVPPEIETSTGLRALVQYRYRMEAVPCVIKKR